MGKLRYLELENFKSYAGKQIVGPFDNFTCVIGPNGSGKSNMMDAVSFVLGVQSRNLRATHLKELIFRKDVDTAPARKASVKLVYEVSDGEVDGKDAGTEIHFMRSITSSGVSTYRLDNKDVTFEVYENMLQSIGVLVKARNFLVFQGDVESVASKSPAELTKLIEQISGSDALSKEYEELLTNKDEAEEATLFAIQKRKMFATQKKEVKEQKDEAELFQSKQQSQQDLKSEHVLVQIWRVKEGMEGHQVAAQAFKKDLEGIKKREAALDDEIQEGKKDLARVSKTLATAENDAAKRTKQISELTPKLEETRARLKSLRKRIAELDKGIKGVQKDRQQQTADVDELNIHIQSLEEAERDIQAELDQASGAGLQLDAKKVEEYTKLRQEVSARTAVERAEEMTIDQDVKGKQQHLARLEAQETSMRVELESGDKLIGEYAERLGKLEGAIKEGTRDSDAMRKERDTKTEELRVSQQRQTTLTAELEEVTSKLRDVGDDRRRNKQEERLSEAVETMQRIFTGVHGKLVDLCRPIQKKYSQAIAVAAGKQMDAIVVESKQVAADCIRYLKDQRIGTCIFLPLDNVESKQVPDRLRTLAPKYRLCVDLMECEDKYKSAMAYALGSTLVCDTLEEAQELAFGRNEKNKIVTIRGHVISKSGSMTGGTSGGGSGDRWEDKEVEGLKRKKTDLEGELSSVRKKAPTRQELVDLETRLKTLLTRIQFSEADRKVTEEKLNQLRHQKELKEKAGKAIRVEMDALRKELTRQEKRQKQLHQQTRDVENEIFRAFSATVGVTNIREYEEKQLSKHQENVKKRTIVAEQRASLTAQLDYELKRDFSGVLQRLQTQEDEAKRDLAAQEKAENMLLQKEEEIRDSLRASNDKLSTARDEKAKVNNAVKKMQTQRAGVLEERDGLSKKLAAEEIQIERGRSQLHEVLQKAQVEEVALPTVDVESESDQDEELRWAGSQTSSKGRRRGHDSDDSMDTDSKEGSRGSRTTESTHFSQADNRAVQQDRNKVAKVDLSSMRKCKSMTKQQLVDMEASLLKRIALLGTELETMQPNMHAVERFEGVTEKLKEVEGALQDQQDKAKDVTTRYEEVKRQRQRLFQECFKHISKVLGVIYKDLTKSTKHPHGGNAYLTLDNQDEPYLAGTRFTAMPPMKRFRDMDQLSGGEKTMAALALLFSIHSFRQAPFFVLDEVDAALDNVNVKKICNYIKQRSHDFQCVVISLKDMFFEHADSLVGVCKDVNTLSSQLLTLDLKKFDDNAPQNEDDEQEQVAPSPISSAGTPAGRSPAGTSLASASRGGPGAAGAGAGAGAGGSGSKLDKKRKMGGQVPPRRTKQLTAVEELGEDEGEGEGEAMGQDDEED